MIKYINNVITHYEITNQNIKDQMIGKIASEITKLGATPEEISYCISNLMPALNK
jgi:hypothetical protein